jgi:transcriptional regulator
MGSLTEEQKAEVVRRYMRGESQAKLAREYQTSRHTIRAALDKKGVRVTRARGLAEARRTIEMPADLLAQIEELAARRGRSVNLEMVDALRAHAEKNLPGTS